MSRYQATKQPRNQTKQGQKIVKIVAILMLEDLKTFTNFEQKQENLEFRLKTPETQAEIEKE
jgi:hypothetical protein